MWVGPWLIPRALAFFRSIRASNQPGLIRPTPPRTRLTLNLLYTFVVACLVGSFPYFAPPNIFRDTGSRLGIASTLLFSRLATVRGGQLSHLDLQLQEKFQNGSMDQRLLYAAYGPDALANCLFCNSAEPSTYMLYALPSLFIPHVVHIGLLGLITSSFFSGDDGYRWRLQATIAGVFLAAVEFLLFLKNDWKQNTTRRNLADVDFFYWRIRVWRLLAFAAVDALFGWALWLTSTNRWLYRPPSVTQQLASLNSTVVSIQAKIATLGQLRNSVLRDDELRGAGQTYWEHEPRIMDELEQQREVLDAKRLALSRMNHDKIQADADRCVEQLWMAFGQLGHPTSAEARSDKKTD
jgi:hypothetical protein